MPKPINQNPTGSLDSVEDDDLDLQDDAGDDAGDDDANEDDDLDGDETEGADALGDAGKKALDAMKAKWKAARAEARTAKQERDALKAAQEAAGKSDDEKLIEQARTEGRQEGLKVSSQRIIRSEIKLAAKGRVADPTLALKLIDIEDLDVDDDGNVDEDTIREAIEDLLEKYPAIAAQGGAPSAFDSARGKSARKQMLSQSDLKGMTPEEITKAYDEGRIKQ